MKPKIKELVEIGFIKLPLWINKGVVEYVWKYIIKEDEDGVLDITYTKEDGFIFSQYYGPGVNINPKSFEDLKTFISIIS